MSSLALYRKYRPTTFAEVTGQEHVVRTLLSALRSNAVSHAYLFAGPRGTGKTTLARLLAKSVNCEKPKKDGEPCNECSSCKDIMANRAMDVVEIDAASNRGIDEIRDIKEGTKFLPAKLKYKIYIIDEAHQLSKDAFNALLKTLEEPPAHAIFILATTEPQKMLATIVSRTQHFDFRKLRVSEITDRLKGLAKKENVKVDEDALILIAHGGRGSVRDAEGLLDKVLTSSLGSDTTRITLAYVKEVLGIADTAGIAEFVGLLLEKKPGEGVQKIAEMLEAGTEAQELGKEIVRYLRYVLVLAVSPESEKLVAEELTKEEAKRMQKQGSTASPESLAQVLENFMEAERQMRYASIPQLPLELAVVRSCGVV